MSMSQIQNMVAELGDDNTGDMILSFADVFMSLEGPMD